MTSLNEESAKVDSDDNSEEVTTTLFDRFLNRVLCQKDLSKEQLEEKPIAYSDLLIYGSRKDKCYILVGIFLSMICGILQTATCVLCGSIANVFLTSSDMVGNGAAYESVILYVIAFAVVGGILFSISFLQNYLLHIGSVSIGNKLRTEFISAVLRQDAEWLGQRNGGEMTSQLNNNIERFQDGIGGKIGLIARGVSNFLASILICFYYNWRTTLVLIWVGPVGAITMAAMSKFAEKPTAENLKTASDASAVAEESILNVKTVAACNGQNTMIEKFASILRKSEQAAVKMYFWNGFFEGFMFFQLYFFYAIGFLQSVSEYFDGEMETPGSVFIVLDTMLMGAYFLGLLGPHLMSLLKARVAAAVVYKTIQRNPSTSDRDVKGISTASVKGEIEFINVHFAYPSRDRPILNGFNWNVHQGESVALIGRSGCGKSTSIGLITRLYDCSKGEILIDGNDISSFNSNELRKIIGIVEQEPSLFNGTINENIRLGREGISDERIREMCKIANAHEFISKLERGYDTLLGIGGISLSGGQKQRIAIARAIACDPKILILDEATSALDTESEQLVQEALKNASKGRTTVVIAHRLSTLRDVDRIYVMDQGVAVEVGTHYELIGNEGLYATLAKAQKVGGKSEEDRAGYESGKHKVVCDNNSALKSNSVSEEATFTCLMDGEFQIDEATGGKKKSASGGLWKFYKSTSCAPVITSLSFICSILRGLEIPLIVVNTVIAYKTLDAGPDEFSMSLIAACSFSLALGIFCWVFLCTASMFSGWAAEKVTNNLRTKVVSNLLNQDATFFDRPGLSNASCIAALSLNAPNVTAALDPRMVLITSNSAAIFFCIVFIFVSNWQIGVTTISVFVVLLIVETILTNRLRNLQNQREKEDRTAELAIEIFEQCRTIQLLASEDYFVEKYSNLQKRMRRIERAISICESINFALLKSFFYFVDFINYIVGMTLLYNGIISPVALFTSAQAASMAGWGIMLLSPSILELSRASQSCKVLFGLAEAPSVYGERKSGEKPDIRGNVSVKNVNFSYPARPNIRVVRNLSFEAQSGESIAFVGSSGCGKSTVISLLERFYMAQSGQLKIDGCDLLSINLSHLRRNIAFVGQEPVLFRGSIFENVSLGVENATLEDVMKVCKIANGHKFVEAFPLGYDTDVGEKGKNLSGGQKQRISIARALLRNPKVLLLDEATSALDSENETIVQEALNVAADGRTSITIAHRLSTIQNADRIYVIENGIVVEMGKHEDLLEYNGKYAALVKAQTIHREDSKTDVQYSEDNR